LQTHRDPSAGSDRACMYPVHEQGSGVVSADTASKSVLIVEDDPALAALLAEVLGEDGYDVRIASDGARALEIVAVQPPAVILLDLMLPGMSGPELYAELRSRGVSAPVLVISASRNGAATARGMGADSFIAKPFDIDEVLTRVEELLRA